MRRIDNLKSAKTLACAMSVALVLGLLPCPALAEIAEEVGDGQPEAIEVVDNAAGESLTDSVQVSEDGISEDQASTPKALDDDAVGSQVDSSKVLDGAADAEDSAGSLSSQLNSRGDTDGSAKTELLRALSDGEDPDPVKTWYGLYRALSDPRSNGRTITLGADLTWSEELNSASTIAPLIVPVNQSVTLDLAGHTIDRGLGNGNAVENGYVIKNEGTLTIVDSGLDSHGSIIGGNNTGDGGGIYNSGKLTIEDGIISGNHASGTGAGIYNGGTLIVEGGIISGNHAGGSGGGVYNGGTLRMKGGGIEGNSSGAYGGGIYLPDEDHDNGVAATLHLNGGSIAGNTCANNGGGVHVSDTASVYVGGTPKVLTNRQGETDDNLYLSGSAKLGFDEPLQEDACLHVTLPDDGDNAYGREVTKDFFYYQGKIASTITSHTISESLVFDNAYAPFVMNGEIWASTNENGQWKLLQDVVAAGSDVMLFGNVKDPDGKSGAIRVKDNKTATIDLNGWTIDRNRTGRGNNGHAIAVEKGSTLTIKDGSQDKSGKITGGYGNEGGGINNRGTLKVEQANITGNDAEYGGGIANYGVLEMTGGKVTGNTADKGGGIYNHNDGNGTASSATNTPGYASIIGVEISANTGDGSGGLRNHDSDSTMVVSNCQVKNNTSKADGGGIDNMGTLTVTDGSIEGNKAECNGGGIWSERALTVSDCAITNNSAPSGYGGGVCVRGTTGEKATITGGSISYNSAKDGGGLYIDENKRGATVELSGVTLAGNNTNEDGGGGITNKGTLTLKDDCSVRDNTSIESGGGIWSEDTLTVDGTYIANNTSQTADGGGICVRDGSATISDTTFTLNKSSDGGGLYVGDDATVTVSGTTSITQNSALEKDGGGIDNSGKLTIEGTCTVTGNTAVRDGSGVWSNDTLKLSGTVKIDGNERTNLYLDGNGTLITINGVLDEASSIGVTAGKRNRFITKKLESGQSYSIDSFKGESACRVENREDSGSTRVYLEDYVDTSHYIKREWTGSRVTETTESVPEGTPTGMAKEMRDPLYIITADTSISYCPKIYGNVGIIIPDGVTLTAKDGIQIMPDATLTIYGQTSDSGRIVAKPDSGPGIGGVKNTDGGNLVVCGGTIEAKGGKNGAGIGGGKNSSMGDVTVYGGKVTATGRTKREYVGLGESKETNKGMDIGAGIGGGGGADWSGTLRVYGGSVNANGGRLLGEADDGYLYSCYYIYFSPAIGSGTSASDIHAKVEVYGGTLTAKVYDIDDELDGPKADRYYRANAIGGGTWLFAEYDDNMDQNDTDIDVWAETLGGPTLNVQGGTVKLYSRYMTAVGALGSITLSNVMKVEHDGIIEPAWNRSNLLKSGASADTEVLISMQHCTETDDFYYVAADENQHQKRCNICDEVLAAEDHSFDESDICTICGYRGANAPKLLKFDSAYGVGTMESVELPKGAKYTLPDCAFTKEGYIFRYWKVEGLIYKYGASNYKAGSTITIGDYDVTATAVWGYEKDVTFDPANGQDSWVQKVADEEKVQRPANPVREGWAFLGWYKAKDDGSLETKAYDFDNKVRSNFTLRAKWGHSVTFYRDEAGTEVLSTKKVAEGTKLGNISLPSNPKREGYYFAGWTATKKDDPAIEYSYKDAMPDEGKSAEDLAAHPCVLVDWSDDATLDVDMAVYPVFIKDRLNVKLEAGEGAQMGTGSDGHEQSCDFTVDMNEVIRMTGLISTTRDGYDLAGWYTADGVLWNGEGWKDAAEADWWQMTPEYADSSKPVKHAERPYNYYTATLTASWTPKTVNVAYELDGGAAGTAGDATATLDDTFTLAGAPTKMGSDFVGWQDSKGTLHSAGEVMDFNDWSLVGDDGKLSFTARYAASASTAIYFDTQGGTAIAPATGEPGTQVAMPDDPTRTGYGFDGWYDAAEGGNKVSFPMTIANVAQTVYAHWTIEQHTISFDMNGATSEQIEDITVDYGADVAAPTAPMREHYTFKGWNPEVPATMPAEDLTVQATWEPETYSVTFKKNESDAGTQVSGFYGSIVAIPEDPTQDGLVFAGWKFAGEDGEAVGTPLYMPDSENGTTICAQWRPSPTTTAETVRGAEDGKISGVTDAMEYRRVGAEEWLDVEDGATEVTGLKAGDYEVRYREEKDFQSDEAATVTIEAGPAAKADAQVFGYSLTLEGEIGVNAYLVFGDGVLADPSRYSVEIWSDDSLVCEKSVSDVTPVTKTANGVDYQAYGFTVTTSAKDYKTFFMLRIRDLTTDAYVDFNNYDGTTVSADAGVDYTILGYLNDRIANSKDPNMVQLAKDMKAYCKYAKHYFDVRDNGCTDEVPTIDGFNEVTLDELGAYDYTVPASIAHFTYKGTTLVLEDKTSFRLYFDSDNPDALSITRDGAEGTLEVKRGDNGYYYVEVPNIAAKQLDTMYDFTIQNDAGEVTTSHSGPFGYARWAIGSTDDTSLQRRSLQHAMMGLYHYNQSAKAYFEGKQ